MSINGTTQWHDKFGCWVTYSVHPAMAMYDRANMPLLEDSLGEFVKKDERVDVIAKKFLE